MLLEKDSKFSAEYSQFSQRIQNVSDNNVKIEMLNLLNQLASYVKRIDQRHLELVFQPSLSEDISIIRSDIIKTRKKLTQMLDSYERMINARAQSQQLK